MSSFQNPDKLDDFLRAIRWSRYQGMEYSCVAVQRDRSGLQNVRTRLILLPKRLRTPFRSEGSGLSVRRGWIDQRQASGALETLRTGRLVIGPLQIGFGGIAENTFCRWDDVSSVESARPRIGWPAHCIYAASNQIGQVFDSHDFDWFGDRMPSMRPGRMMSWNHVAAMIGPDVELAVHNGTLVEVFAPFCAQIRQSRHDPRTRTIRVTIEGFFDPSSSRMEVLLSDRATKVISVAAARTWRQSRDGSWTASLPLKRAEGLLDVWLASDGIRLGSAQVLVPGIQSRLLDAIEGGDEWLEGLLFPAGVKGKSQSAFERGVVALLALGGHAAIPLGAGHGDRYYDVLYATSAGRVLVAECTVASPGPKKLADLRARAQRTLTRLRRPGERLRVTACAFTPLAQESIPEEIIAETAKLGVTLVHRERIKSLLDLARSGHLDVGLWEELDGWQPKPEASRSLSRRRSVIPSL